MIYFFYGENEYDLKSEVKKWKDGFISKFWDFNFFHINDINSYSENDISDILLSSSFMADKKLVIVDDYPNSDNKNFDELFLKNLWKIPPENMILFNSLKVDKRSKIFKELISLSDKVTEFKNMDEFDLKNLLQKKYEWRITPSALSILSRYKLNNKNKIISEIEKLSILYPLIGDGEITENVSMELEESIFDFIWNILSNDRIWAIDKMRTILEQTNIYAFYSAFVSNLTNTYFIELYKSLWISKSQIVFELDLWKKWFLVDKKYNLTFNGLECFYLEIMDIDRKMKSWELLESWDSYIMYEIEKSILKN